MDRARYCLEQLEIAKHGEHAELGVLGTDSVHVEHIIPRRINTKKSREEFGDWPIYLGEKARTQHPKLVQRIGDLTLFAGTLNIVASNNALGMKKEGYKASSILLTKELAQMRDFKFSHLEARSRTLASLAVEQWPAP
ncbi:HNH endonuclease family protein [Phyllobacterium sp. CCNWLW109]|uniref:HNH endonuclease family protein n=1 Tax=Phyllobacterium sp. CCNWLW109 TaxID=3127479 RepID=UPI003FCD5FAA